MKKIFFFISVLFLSCFFLSCDKGEIEELSTKQGKTGLSSTQVKNNDEYSQLYITYWNNFGVATSLPLNNTNDVIGAPFITESIIDGIIPGYVVNFQERNFQWTIKGKVNTGKMEISFSDGDRILGSLYEGIFTEDTGIAEILINNENGQVEYELRKLIEVDTTDFGNYEYNSHRIHIYYADKDFNKFNNGNVSLKAGWNFVETFTLLYKDGRKYPFEYKTGLVSQDINDFYKAGYRWFYSGTVDG